MPQFREKYIQLRNDYEDLLQKYELSKKIALQLIERENCSAKKDTYCHACDKHLSCPMSLSVHLQSKRHLNNAKAMSYTSI